MLAYPPNHRVRPLDVVFEPHTVGTSLTRFHLPNRLHFKRLTVSLHSHGTRFFLFQSTNLFQDGTLQSSPIKVNQGDPFFSVPEASPAKPPCAPVSTPL